MPRGKRAPAVPAVTHPPDAQPRRAPGGGDRGGELQHAVDAGDVPVRARPPRHDRPGRRPRRATCSVTSWCRATPTSGTSSTCASASPRGGQGIGARLLEELFERAAANAQPGLHARGACVKRDGDPPLSSQGVPGARHPAGLLLRQRRGRDHHVARRRARGRVRREPDERPDPRHRDVVRRDGGRRRRRAARSSRASWPPRPSCTRPTAASSPRSPPATTWARSTRSSTSALERAGLRLDDVSRVAVTQRPGLIGALLIGVATAKAIAYAAGKPLVMVDHLHGHIAASWLEPVALDPPFVSLVASGGHTRLDLVTDLRAPGAPRADDRRRRRRGDRQGRPPARASATRAARRSSGSPPRARRPPTASRSACAGPASATSRSPASRRPCSTWCASTTRP